MFTRKQHAVHLPDIAKTTVVSTAEKKTIFRIVSVENRNEIVIWKLGYDIDMEKIVWIVIANSFVEMVIKIKILVWI